MPKISREWTPSDRLLVVGLIGAQMVGETQKRNGLRMGDQVFRWAERIMFTAQLDATFLEANREQILDGLPVQS